MALFVEIKSTARRRPAQVGWAMRFADWAKQRSTVRRRPMTRRSWFGKLRDTACDRAGRGRCSRGHMAPRRHSDRLAVRRGFRASCPTTLQGRCKTAHHVASGSQSARCNDRSGAMRGACVHGTSGAQDFALRPAATLAFARFATRTRTDDTPREHSDF